MLEPEPLRLLTSDELNLLRWMMENGTVGLHTFYSQIEGLRVARSCSCGCPSVRLEVAEGAPLGKDCGDKLVGDFAGKTAQGDLVGVLLFQREGKLTELEVYSIDGVGPR